jgi:hypothetical protein
MCTNLSNKTSDTVQMLHITKRNPNIKSILHMFNKGLIVGQIYKRCSQHTIHYWSETEYNNRYSIIKNEGCDNISMFYTIMRNLQHEINRIV